jgi:uncharacterized protein YwbE
MRDGVKSVKSLLGGQKNPHKPNPGQQIDIEIRFKQRDGETTGRQFGVVMTTLTCAPRHPRGTRQSYLNVALLLHWMRSKS